MSREAPWFEPRSYTTKELLDLVDDGKLALPQFQRSFKWAARDVAALLRSVARNWPAGSLLMLRMGPDVSFGVRNITGAPGIKDAEVEWLLLDGQQRTTALYHSLRTGSNTAYYIDVDALRGSDTFEDEHLLYMRRDSFYKRYPTVQDQAAAGVLEVSVVANETQWNRWLRYFPDESEQEVLIQLKQDHFPGLSGYIFPANTLSRDTSLAAIAKIFETINRRGLRLDTFDLMVAILFPHGFRLRDKWNQVYEERRMFRSLQIDTGLEILQLIALQAHLEQKERYAAKQIHHIKVKGVRQSDLLELDHKRIAEEWDDAVEAYEAALTFVQQRCGVIRANLLPQRTMILALADALHASNPARKGFVEDLERWFWASCFSESYGEGANTRVVSDAEQLRAWRVSASATPAVVGRFDPDKVDLLETISRKRIVSRALAACLVANHAPDWLTNDRLQDIDDSETIELHHIVPNNQLERDYYGTEFEDGVAEEDPIAVMTPLLGSSNKSLRDKSPREVSAIGVRDRSLEAHLIDPHLFRATGFETASIRSFLDDRERRLRLLMTQMVNT